MKTKPILFVLFCLVFLGCRSFECLNATDGPWPFAVPDPPYYGDSTQWYCHDRDGQVDIFYIVSTETGDYKRDRHTYHHADTYADSTRLPILGEMQGVDGLLSGDMNFYSPYYRQCSLETFTKDRYVAKRMPVAVRDVKNAFRFYLAKINRDRPFILAGFSQGAMIMLELLQEMDDDTYRRMVAAYAIGVSIPEETVTRCPRIVAAQGAADQGVTVCYNSVRDASCALWDRSAVVINPVNWRTDTTSALLVTEPTPRLPVKEQQKDTMVVHLDVESGLLFVDGYSATDYVLPLIGREGNYHSREIWLYRDALRENMALRAAEFLRGR